MANYYIDNSELKFHLNHPLMEKIVRLKEREYSFKKEFDFLWQSIPKSNRDNINVANIIEEILEKAINKKFNI